MFKLQFKKKSWHFWTTVTVESFLLEPETGRMNFVFKDGSVLEIPKWNSFYCKLDAPTMKRLREIEAERQKAKAEQEKV
jgi:protoporphyrinogen oxidase